MNEIEKGPVEWVSKEGPVRWFLKKGPDEWVLRKVVPIPVE